MKGRLVYFVINLVDKLYAQKMAHSNWRLYSVSNLSPIIFSEGIMDDNLQFAILLTELSKRLASTAGQWMFEEHLEPQEKEKLNLKKISSLEREITFNCLKRLIYDYELDSANIDPNSTTAHNYTILKNAVIGLEMEFELNPDKPPVPFAALLDEIYPPISQKVRDWMLAGLNDKIREQCRSFIRFYNPNGIDVPDNDMVMQAERLADRIFKDAVQLKQLSKNVLKAHLEKESLIKTFELAIEDSLEFLERLVEEIDIFEPPLDFRPLLLYLNIKSKLFDLRIERMELKAQRETYFSKPVEALEKFRHLMKTDTEDVQTKIKKVEQMLHSYDALGENFKEVVQDYAKLKKMIDGRKAAYQERRRRRIAMLREREWQDMLYNE